MNESINLTEIKKGFPGITPVACNAYYEACMVCLHRNKHIDGVILDLKGEVEAMVTLYWEDYFDEQIDRGWQDQIYCTDHGAVCLSAMLVKNYTEYTIIERARIGTGIDYWMGREEDIPFLNSARLEISGIFQESEQNTMDKRFNIKKKQTIKSDETQLPVYISIIEFGHPKAIFARK